MLGGEQEFLAHAFVPQQPARHLNQPLRLASLVSFPPDKGNRRRRQSLPAGSRNLARRARPGPSYRRCTEREPKQYARRRSSRKGARSDERQGQNGPSENPVEHSKRARIDDAKTPAGVEPQLRAQPTKAARAMRAASATLKCGASMAALAKRTRRAQRSAIAMRVAERHKPGRWRRRNCNCLRPKAKRRRGSLSSGVGARAERRAQTLRPTEEARAPIGKSSRIRPAKVAGRSSAARARFVKAMLPPPIIFVVCGRGSTPMRRSSAAMSAAKTPDRIGVSQR